MERFTAEVLPDNSRMIQTFRDAGYRVASGYHDGVITLEFPIDPTDTAIGVMRDREHAAEAASIDRFFQPKSVAIIGASRRQDTIGQVLVRNLVMADFTGRVYVVNPSAPAVSGMPAYKNVNDIPDDVDVAIVAVPAEAVTDVVLDCANKGVHGLIVISSGFAETGEEGRRRQRHLAGLCRSYGLRLIGPNCLGVINTDPSVQVNASLSSVMPARGRAGFFCQSGALGSAILEKVKNRGLGLSTFVSAGNRADVSGNDLLQYWEEDDATEVVMMYLESIGNPRKFSRIARRVSQRKPIVAVRSGRTTQGVPMGHTVRRIGAPQAAVDAMFRQAGVIQVDTLDDMFDVAQLARPPAAPARAPGRDRRQLRRAGPARRRRRLRGRPGRQPLGRARCGGDGRGLRGRAGRRHRRPGRGLGDRGLHPAARRLRRGGRQRAGGGGGAVRQATGLLLPRCRGHPRACCASLTWRARRRDAARCRRTPRWRRRCAPWPASWSTPCGCTPPTARPPTPVRSTTAPRAGWSRASSPSPPWSRRTARSSSTRTR
ncbi:CoA-binding protein [Nocardioides convexus]|uniref:CoA-binding protein n=1 Tax=Nocardioides convexus TaxID=2712224 RepID=UPI003100E63B